MSDQKREEHIIYNDEWSNQSYMFFCMMFFFFIIMFSFIPRNSDCPTGIYCP
jgi:hypothetical protein